MDRICSTSMLRSPFLYFVLTSPDLRPSLISTKFCRAPAQGHPSIAYHRPNLKGLLTIVPWHTLCRLPETFPSGRAHILTQRIRTCGAVVSLADADEGFCVKGEVCTLLLIVFALMVELEMPRRGSDSFCGSETGGTQRAKRVRLSREPCRALCHGQMAHY